jgi:hypothetical protein
MQSLTMDYERIIINDPILQFKLLDSVSFDCLLLTHSSIELYLNDEDPLSI